MIRWQEFNADEFSIRKGYGIALRRGMVKLTKKNKANLNPDPLFAALKYSHPALIERITAMDNVMKKVCIEKGESDLDDLETIHSKYQGLNPDKGEITNYEVEGGELDDYFKKMR